MKNTKNYAPSFLSRFLILLVILYLLYWFFHIKSSAPNALALPIGDPEKPVILKGQLILKLFPGPPEYSSLEGGDRPDHCWVLRLDRPSFLTAITTPVAEPANVLDNIIKWANPDEIMLVLDAQMENVCPQYQAQEILSEGYLFHAHTTHHYTPILMDVKGLSFVGAPGAK